MLLDDPKIKVSYDREERSYYMIVETPPKNVIRDVNFLQSPIITNLGLENRGFLNMPVWFWLLVDLTILIIFWRCFRRVL